MFLDDVSPSAVTLSFDSNTAVFKNNINRKHQYAKLQGDMWKARIKFDNLNQDEADQYIAWIMTLNGQVGTFNCPVVTQTIISVSVVQSSTNSTVTVDNIGALKIGKYFSINDELKAITEINDKTISFKPNFRVRPTVNQTLKTNRPNFRARLSKDEVVIISSTAKSRGGVSNLYQSFLLDCVEDL